MKTTLACIALLCLTLSPPAARAEDTKPAAPAAAPAAKAADDPAQVLYALGTALGRNLSMFELTPAEIEQVQKGLADAATGKATYDPAAWGMKLQELQKQRVQRAGTAYLAKAATQPGAVKTKSGLIYIEQQAGTGPSPKATDKVKVNYRGTLTDGREFDSSFKRNQPATFGLDQVIPCWTEGLQKMKAGGKARLVCPQEIGYGENGSQNIPPFATLVFEVELLEVNPK